MVVKDGQGYINVVHNHILYMTDVGLRGVSN